MSLPRVQISCLLSVVAAQDVFPANHCEHDVGGWPIFDSMQDLTNDLTWAPYFERVYGAIPSSGYPICPGSSQFIWLDAAESAGLAGAGIAGALINCREEKPTGKNLVDGTHYTGQTDFEGDGVASYIANSGFAGVAVPAGNWVEVFRTAYAGDRGPAWYYMSVGSGVWYNVGNTVSYKEHADGVRDLLGTSCHDVDQRGRVGTPTECENDFVDLFQAAILRGHDSLQFTNHYDCTCGLSGPSSYTNHRLCPTEIIDLTDIHPDLDSNGPVCRTNLRGGWEASLACDCQEDVKAFSPDGQNVQYSNCGAQPVVSASVAV